MHREWKGIDLDHDQLVVAVVVGNVVARRRASVAPRSAGMSISREGDSAIPQRFR
jgi:hypothetical protein